MKNLDLNYMGVQEMNTLEMQETDGGLVCLLFAAAGVLLLASSCTSNISIQIGNNNISIQIGGANNYASQSGGGPISADSSRLEIPINVPIGY